MKLHVSAVAMALYGVIAMGVASAETQTAVKFTVYFEHNAADLTPEGAQVAEEVASFIKGNPLKTIVLTGHCDTSEPHPMSLAQARAKAVADRLRELHVPDGVSIVVKASKDLPAPTRPNAAEPLNRCVTIAY